MPKIAISDLFRSLQPTQPAFAFAGTDGGSGNPAGAGHRNSGTMHFSSNAGGGSGSGNDDDYDEYDDYSFEEPVQETRRNPGAPRARASASGGSGDGGGRQRTIQFQPEERYWTEYLRIALPIIGLLLMIGLFWFWAAELTDDDGGPDDPVGTEVPGTTEIITPESTPRPTDPPVVQPTSEDVSTPDAADTTPQADDETPTDDETPADAGDTEGEFAEGSYVSVIDSVNLRDTPSTEGEGNEL